MRAHLITWAAALATLGLAAGLAWADPLNVTDFDSLGPFPSEPGAYSINTSEDPPTMTLPDGTVIYGVVANDIAVFTFDRIPIRAGMFVYAFGDRPLALLSYSDVAIRHTGFFNVQSAGGGAGGATGRPGEGPGGGGGAAGLNPGGGGGFGGRGGGNGGDTYGDLASLLEGGSGGGGGSSSDPRGVGGAGGSGGGALEIGALGEIFINQSSVWANGAPGHNGTGVRSAAGGGGGSGGGIFLHGDAVRLHGSLQARGGNGGSGAPVGGGKGAGGGGGRVLILTGPGGFHGRGTIDVSGGAGSPDHSTDGEPGTVTIGSLEDPGLGGWTLGGLGCLVVFDGARRGRRRLRDFFAARLRCP